MNKKKSEIGVLQGTKYLIIHDKLKNQQACDDKYKEQWRWFLWINGEYIGDFSSKKKALDNIK